jgi:hypothetical protein
MVIAASFTLGVFAVAPAAQAGLLGGDNSNSPTVEGVGLPVGGDLVGGLLSGNLLGGDLVGGVLGTVEGVLGGGVLGGDGLVGGVLGGSDGGLLGGGLPVVSGVLGGDGLLGGVAGGDGGLLAGEGIVALVPDLSFVPGLGSVNEILQAFSDSGSLVPGLQVLGETGVLGLLGSL